MKKLLRIFAVFTLVVVMVVSFPEPHASSEFTVKTVYKNIAVYPSIVPAIKVLQYSVQYGWTVGNTHYRFNVTEISRMEVEGHGPRPLTTDNYDVFVIGASARQYIHGISDHWKENVRQFVADGGGYLGICGGANAASVGMKSPNNIFDFIITTSALGIANVYINDDQEEEWQYLYKSAGVESGVPILCELKDHSIMNVSPNNPRIIRYEGGPAMYPADSTNPLMGEIVPLAVYAEEISDKAPVHYWNKENGTWHIEKPVITDLKGQFAAIATTYGMGRVVLFGPHPEEYTVLSGYVEEFPGRTKYTLFRENYLYRWVSNEEGNWSYNWWMTRRAVAWAAGIPDSDLPSVTTDDIFLIEPNVWHPAVYVNGRKIAPSFGTTLIIGGMDFLVESNEDANVTFYFDGTMCYTDNTPPYIWSFNLPAIGFHEIRAETKREDDTEIYARIEVCIFNI